MSSPQPIATAKGNLKATTTAYELQFVTPWQVLYNGSKAVAALELRGHESSNLEVVVKYRTAGSDPNDPESWTSMTGSALSADGIQVFTVDTSTSAFDEEGWIQFGVFARLTSGTTYTSFARVWTSVVAGGWVAGRGQVGFDQGVTSVVVPIGQPFSAAGVVGLMFAAVFTGIAGALTPTPVYRTFESGDLTRPGEWSTGTAESAVSSDGRYAYHIAATTTDKMLVQAGLKYTSNSSTTGMANLTILATK